MLKVFLVEDEFVVRQGIKKNIDWEAHGYEFCGDASDGELALPMIRKARPDIIITDIKMPFMDGLELSRIIKKEFPWMEIIILSGYEEFSYAKEAIRLGISRYLLKPISGVELLKEVDALSEKILEDRRSRELQERYRQEMAENTLQERRKLFQYLVTGNKSVSDLIEMADGLDLDLSALWYNILLIKLSATNHDSQEEFSRRLVEAENRIFRFSNDRILIFDRNLEGKALLLKADSQEELQELQDTYLHTMQEIVSQYHKVQYAVGIGVPVNRLRELSNSFEKASHAFAHRYFRPDSCIVDGASLGGEILAERESFDISHVDPKLVNRSRVLEFLKKSDREEAFYFVNEFFHSIGMEALNSNVFRQYVVMDFYFCVAQFLEDLQFSRDDIKEIDINLCMTQGVEEAREYMIALLKKAIELRDQSASNRYGDIVNEVIRFIENNYADGDLSLNTVASHVKFSPNHLSMIFSQQTGQTLIRFLTDYRMNKAQEMLRCTNLKSSAIAYDVGYKDPHYFSYLFKKIHGITPTQYRGVKGTEGEEA